MYRLVFWEKKNWSEKYFSNFIVHNTVVENSKKDIGLLWVFSSVVGFLVSWYFVQNCSCSKEPAQLFPALLKLLNQWYYSNRITLSSQRERKKGYLSVNLIFWNSISWNLYLYLLKMFTGFHSSVCFIPKIFDIRQPGETKPDCVHFS